MALLHWQLFLVLQIWHAKQLEAAVMGRIHEAICALLNLSV
jgi:hypothetical protein